MGYVTIGLTFPKDKQEAGKAPAPANTEETKKPAAKRGAKK